MFKKGLLKFTLSLSLMLSGCTVNILEEFSKKNTNSAIMSEIDIQVNAGNYATALGLFSTLTAAFLALRTTQYEKARVEALICGVNFFTMTETLTTDLGALKGLIQSLMEQFNGATQARIDACVASETTLVGIGTAANRTEEENWVMTYVAFGKIGNVVSLEADTDFDDVIDGTFNYCSDPTTAHVNEVNTAFYHLDQSLDQLFVSTGGSSFASLLYLAIAEPIVGVCASIFAPDGVCDFATTGAVTATARRGAKAAIGTDEIVNGGSLFLGIGDLVDCGGGGLAEFVDCTLSCAI